jgi:hypothetical protein
MVVGGGKGWYCTTMASDEGSRGNTFDHHAVCRPLAREDRLAEVDLDGLQN